jgi:DNA-binding transcriptional ArsR family regulator
METQTLFRLEADTLNALAHPARLEILELLRQGECCVCHIQAMLDQRQAYISQHLNVLRRAGLVVNRKDGLRVYYKVTDPQVFDLVDIVREILRLQRGGHLPELLETRSTSSGKPCNCPQCSTPPAC